MVAIVKAFLIVGRVNTGDAVGVQIIGLLCIYKGMLRPIARHHGKTGEHERQNKHYEGCLEIEKTQECYQQDIDGLTGQYPPGKFVAMLFAEVKRQVQDTKEIEMNQVSQECTHAIAPVLHCGAKVFFVVIFGMVHGNVVVKISFGCLPKKET